MPKTAAQLRAELAQAELRERQDKDALRKATPIKFKYTIGVPIASRSEKLYDPDCCLYEIKRHTLNKEEAKAAGHPDSSMREGRANYVFNSWSTKIVCAVGGGTHYIFSNYFMNPQDGADQEAFDAIGEFLREHQQGGDITEIVEKFQNSRHQPNAKL
jgi:hypothetical protein